MDDLEPSILDINSENSSVKDESVETNSSNLACATIEIADADGTPDVKVENIAEENIESDSISEECLSLIVRKEHRLLVAQTMFKKSIKISLKSFLISLSLTFLNFFI